MSTTITTNRPDADVVSVGAGPTGLALATILMRSGIAPVIVDKLATGQNTSRAAVVHAHTLEVLEQLGVSDRLAHKGLKLAKFSIRDRDRVLVRLRFDTLPTRHAYLLMLPQDMTEKILAEGLAKAGGAVRRGCTVEALVETPRGYKRPWYRARADRRSTHGIWSGPTACTVWCGRPPGSGLRVPATRNRSSWPTWR